MAPASGAAVYTAEDLRYTFRCRHLSEKQGWLGVRPRPVKGEGRSSLDLSQAAPHVAAGLQLPARGARHHQCRAAWLAGPVRCWPCPGASDDAACVSQASIRSGSFRGVATGTGDLAMALASQGELHPCHAVSRGAVVQDCRDSGTPSRRARKGEGPLPLSCTVLICPARSRRGISPLGSRHGRREAANCERRD